MNAHGPGIPPREASRIELRHLCETDEALYCSLYTDPETMAFVSPPLSAELAIRNFHEVLHPEDSGHGVFIVLEKATGAAIGLCGWHSSNARKRQLEIGILLNARGRSRRYSKEAITAVVDRAFAALPIDTVWVQYQRANSAADRLFVGLGMQLHGIEAGKRAQPTRVVRSICRSMWRCI
ncbi:MAG TPA: GNAT family N-acetyltransferase [Xanthomonadaceae bacterium]|jgi:RimJ/RimL family protein N-acetyltransferase